MQGEPPATGFDPAPQRRLLPLRRAQVTRVGDEQISRSEPLDVTVVARDIDADVVVLGEQLEKLEAGEVEVMEAPAADETRAQRPWSHRAPPQVCVSDFTVSTTSATVGYVDRLLAKGIGA